jgi:hypothetical protein
VEQGAVLGLVGETEPARAYARAIGRDDAPVEGDGPP